MQIFDRRDTQRELLAPSALGEFFTHAAEPMLVLSAGLDVVAANPAAEGALGLTGLTHTVSFLDLLPTEAREPMQSLLRAAINGTPLRRPTAVTCRRLDGAVFPAEVTASRLEVKNRSYLAAVIHDRSESDAALAELRQEQQLYETLFDLSPIPLREEDFTAVASWFNRLRTRGVSDLEEYLTEHPEEVMDAIAQIKTVRVNRAMLELMEASSLEELNSHGRAQMTDEVIWSFRNEFITLWNGGTHHEAEFVGLSLDGEPYECSLTLSAQSVDGQLDFSRVIVAIQDITALRSYERTLENLIAGKDRFVASISHELRTPLASVLGLSVELFEHWDQFQPEEAREFMGDIARSATDLATLVEDLLLAAQIEVGNGVQSQPIDFELAAEVESAVEECLHSGDLAMPPAMRLEEVKCFADPGRVRQIVRNLVTNAGRYGGASVEVVVSTNAGKPTVEIRDDGLGIPAAEWDRIFNPYEQVQGTEAARGALGLGLAISRQLAEVMGGSLTYEYRDEKSIFSLKLRAGGEDSPAQ